MLQAAVPIRIEATAPSADGRGAGEVRVFWVSKGLHALSLGEADQGAQALDQELALVVRHGAFAGRIH